MKARDRNSIDELCKEELWERMEAARNKTLWLLEQVPDDYLKVRIHDFYSPIGWHFGHIGMTEEHWTVRTATGGPITDLALTFLFANIPENPKESRVRLPDRAEIIEYLAATRAAALKALEGADTKSSDPLLREGYAWDFALQHECQHQETIAEMLQLIRQRQGAEAGYTGFTRFGPAKPTRMMPIPSGVFRMGSNARTGYDNERCVHDVPVAAFSLDRLPVTAAQWAQFVKQGGYLRPELWSKEGWQWRLHNGVELPEYWLRRDDSYAQYSACGLRAIHPDEPVASVSWYEADAYVRWIGKRLPTEREWEYAAAWDASAGSARLYPWGDSIPTTEHACFGLNAWQPAPPGPRGAGSSLHGILDMAGSVWEWTSSPFLPYPGFEAYPYDGYSKDHMDGTHFACRGGSWATAAPILRCSFRNWYVPTYRQGILGVRCAL